MTTTNGHGPDHDAASPAQEAASASPASRMEQRLWEAWQGLCDNFVDPRDALWDDDGSWWQLVGNESPDAEQASSPSGPSRSCGESASNAAAWP